jgi:hypothetical protein
LSRFVDRGAVTAAYVGIGMALTIGLSFLLVIPVEPVYWALALPAGLLIGYYANARSGRGAGAWRRILANGIVAGLATGITMAALLLGIKAIFFTADDGYRDPGLGGRLDCATGVDCVYQRYRAEQGDQLAAAGVTDAATFGGFYWSQQLSTSGLVLLLAVVGSAGGAFAYGTTRPREG